MKSESSRDEFILGARWNFLRKICGGAVLLLALTLLPLMYWRLFQKQVPDFGLVKIPLAALTYGVLALLLLTPEKVAAFWRQWSKLTRCGFVLLLVVTLSQAVIHPGTLGAALALIVLPLTAAVYA
ncbi:MAG: hypothetical protein RR060_06015, partial [Victivallaceae bacterium]